MADQTEKPKLGTRPPLGLKRTVETGKVKQSFSHGRSNTVVVEGKKRRILGRPGEAPPAPEPVAEVPAPVAPARPAPAAPAPRKPSATDDITRRMELQDKLLREAEEARLTALEKARRREARALKDASEAERRRAEENRKAEEAAAEEQAALARQRAEEQARAAEAPAEPQVVAPAVEEEEERGARRPGGGHAPAPRRPEPARPSRGRDEQRQRGKLTVTRALSDEDDSRARSLA